MTLFRITDGIVLFALLAGLLVGCQDRATSSPAPPSARDVEIVQLASADIPAVFEYIGRTASSQRIEIRARVSGYLDEIRYEEGTLVDADQPLFTIDPKPYEARLRAAQAAESQQRARVENAEALLKRVEPLAEARAVALKELDDARGRLKEAAAALEGAQANVYESQLNLGYTKIASPIRGIAGASSQREGAYIGTGAAPLTYVARVDPIWVEFSVSETEVLRGRQSRVQQRIVAPEAGEFRVAIQLADGTEHPHRGRISFADAIVDEQTGTFLVRAEVPNPDRTIRPGQYVRIALHGAYRPDALAVPQRAVQQSPKGPFVWVVSDQNRAELRPIVLGPWLGDGWIVEEGLADGDRVIAKGLLGLRPEAPVNIVSIMRFDQPSPIKADAPENTR